MKIGLLFGSFNPIHNGHLQIAEYMLMNTELDKIWFVISPQNPFKLNDLMLNENQRLELVKLAVDGNDKLEICDIEFSLDRPNFTINTLIELSKIYPQNIFYPIIGGDNFQNFHKWKEHEKIATSYEILVYKRTGFEENNMLTNKNKIKIFNAPLLQISSTQIRENIKNGLSVEHLVSVKINDFITANNLYK